MRTGRLFRFWLVDGTAGSTIYPEPVSLEQVKSDCVDRFGAHRLAEVTFG